MDLPGWSRQLWDAHCHLHDTMATVDAVGAAPIERFCIMGVRPEDWPNVHAVALQWPHKIVPAFGIHPWFAHLFSGSSDWQQDLTERLNAHPSAVVGEIGLDSRATIPGSKAVDIAAQEHVFKQQLAVAADLGRPVSVHCVRAYGKLLEILKSSRRLPPRIMLHSYGGGVEMLRAFDAFVRSGAATQIFFSFSSAVSLRSPKAVAAIAAVAEDRLLVESDRHATHDCVAALVDMCGHVAAARTCSVEHTASTTRANAKVFFAM